MSENSNDSPTRFDELKPGDRVEVDHLVTVGQESWTTTTAGQVVHTERRRHGLHHRRSNDDKVFSDAIASGGRVKAICGKGMADLSRKEIDLLTEQTIALGAKGLAWIKIKETFESPIAKFFPEETLRKMAERLQAAP